MIRSLFLFLFLAGVTTNLSAQNKIQTGKASFYANKFEGRKTASGEIFSQSKLTAAHKTLPFGTSVKVTNLANHKSVVVIVNDRGPFVPGRIIDVSYAAAKILGFTKLGVANVSVEVLDENENEAIINKKAVIEKSIFSKEAAFYHLVSEQFEPEGFAVQIGSFKESDHLIRLTNQLENEYRKRVTVQIAPVQAANIYSVLIGYFKKRTQAENFKEKVIQKYPGSFVVDFSKMTLSPN